MKFKISKIYKISILLGLLTAFISIKLNGIGSGQIGIFEFFYSVFFIPIIEELFYRLFIIWGIVAFVSYLLNKYTSFPPNDAQINFLRIYFMFPLASILFVYFHINSDFGIFSLRLLTSISYGVFLIISNYRPWASILSHSTYNFTLCLVTLIESFNFYGENQYPRIY